MQTLRTLALKLSNSEECSHQGSDTEVSEWMIHFQMSPREIYATGWDMESSAGSKE